MALTSLATVAVAGRLPWRRYTKAGLFPGSPRPAGPYTFELPLLSALSLVHIPCDRTMLMCSLLAVACG